MEGERTQKSEEQQEKIPIPDDILILIFNRLPLKALYRLKAVTKLWSPLIQNLRPPLFLGFFYRISSYDHSYFGNNTNVDRIFCYIDTEGIHNSAIDPTLSFLPLSPLRRHDLVVHDCCNGLLLVRSDPNSFSSVSHRHSVTVHSCSYVCNPLTKSCTRFSGDNAGIRGIRVISLLDFDPQVSPHFKIVSFSHIQDRQLRIRVLSSGTPTMSWRQYKPVSFRQDPSDGFYKLMGNHHHHALWKGSLYSSFSSDWLKFGDAGKIMRFGSLEEEKGGRDDGVDCELIELPAGTKNPSRVSLWRLRGKLCLAGIDQITTDVQQQQQQARLRVWSLSTRDQTVWEMEHDSIISSNLLRLDGLAPPYIAGFHPLLDVVFILCKGMVYVYDLKRLSLSGVCRIGLRGWLSTRAAIFPFFPSSVDYQIEWETD